MNTTSDPGSSPASVAKSAGSPASTVKTGPKRIMIIGASGFLGRHVWHQAVAAGLEVCTGGRSALPASPRHQQMDLTRDDPDVIAARLAAAVPDVVVNCAGATAGGPDVLAAVNITGVYTLAQAMLRTGRPARLVHLGSAAEYGYSEPGVPVTESAPPRPAGVYGATKLAGTRLVQLAAVAGLDAVVLRVFNPVGPGAPEESMPGRLATELRRAQARGTEVRLGSLDAVRDFVDVRDVADAVLAAATGPVPLHAVLNIGSGRGVPVRVLAKELLAISGYPGAIREDAPGSARSAGLMWQEADIACALADLGWRPQRGLACSLGDLWEATR
jgi:NDP-hexose 4-ketoreductase